jgi:TonB family protein
MEKFAGLAQNPDRRLFAGGLILSLCLHLGVVGLLLAAGWGPMAAPPLVFKVDLVAGPEAGGGPGPAAAPKSGTPSPLATRPLPLKKPRYARRLPVPASPVQETTPPIPKTASTSLTLASPPRTPGPIPATLPGSDAKAGSSGGGTGSAVLGYGPGSGSGGSGQGGGPGGPGTAQSRYFSLVRARILAHRHYPSLARLRHQEGLVRVRFSLSPGGTLRKDVEVVRPSGYHLLDEQARRCVLAAAPFPPFPVELQRDHLTIEVPIVYRLTDGGI